MSRFFRRLVLLRAPADYARLGVRSSSTRSAGNQPPTGLRLSEAEENGLDDEEVQVTAYHCQRFAADPAQLASGSLIGYGTDLLSHSVRNLLQSGDVIRSDLYVMVEVAIAAGEWHRKEQSGDH